MGLQARLKAGLSGAALVALAFMPGRRAEPVLVLTRTIGTVIDVPALLLSVLLAAQGLPAGSRSSPPLAPVELAVQILDAKGEVPHAVQAGDFTVQEDGQARPVAELAPLSKPWRITIYVDRVLSSSRTLRAATGSLAERARELAALGA